MRGVRTAEQAPRSLEDHLQNQNCESQVSPRSGADLRDVIGCRRNEPEPPPTSSGAAPGCATPIGPSTEFPTSKPGSSTDAPGSSAIPPNSPGRPITPPGSPTTGPRPPRRPYPITSTATTSTPSSNRSTSGRSTSRPAGPEPASNAKSATPLASADRTIRSISCFGRWPEASRDRTSASEPKPPYRRSSGPGLSKPSAVQTFSLLIEEAVTAGSRVLRQRSDRLWLLTSTRHSQRMSACLLDLCQGPAARRGEGAGCGRSWPVC